MKKVVNKDNCEAKETNNKEKGFIEFKEGGIVAVRILKSQLKILIAFLGLIFLWYSSTQNNIQFGLLIFAITILIAYFSD